MKPYEVPSEVQEVLDRFRVCELSTLAKDGTPITHPVCTMKLEDGRFYLSTAIGLPQKAFNIRRNPKVSMLFSEPTGSGLTRPPVVLVQGDGVAPDEVVTSIEGQEDFLLHRIFRRQPDSAPMSAWPMRLVTWWYFMRIAITVTPRRIRYWPDGDMCHEPTEIALEGA
jgi:general stress protein 26